MHKHVLIVDDEANIREITAPRERKSANEQTHSNR